MRRGWLLLMAATLTVAACGGGGQQARTSDTSVPVSAENFSARGPYAVGATRLAIDAQHPVEVFYPADRDAVPANAVGYRYTPEDVWGEQAASFPPDVVWTVETPDAWFDIPASTHGPFPLVVISHGYGVMRFSYTFHAAHLASWGYAVAVPEHPTRDLAARLRGQSSVTDVPTILDTVALLDAENVRVGGVLDGRIATDKVAVEGHSAGGTDAKLAAADDRVDTWIGIGTAALDPDGSPSATPPDKPSMLIAGDHDITHLPAQTRATYDGLPAPKRFVLLANTGPAIFINDCAWIQERGSSPVLDFLGFGKDSPERAQLENGCRPDENPVGLVVATWNHLDVAQLNLVFGIAPDVATASLQRSYLDATFPGTIAEYVAEN